jgi:hypothetical protein
MPQTKQVSCLHFAVLVLPVLVAVRAYTPNLLLQLLPGHALHL